MKENSFRFKESFGNVVLSMTDKQAGQLIKGLSGYVFEGRKLQCKDAAIISSFTLIKTALDAEERDKQNGRIGGLISQEQKRKRSGILVITETKEQTCPMEKIFQDILSDTSKNSTKSEGGKCCINQIK